MDDDEFDAIMREAIAHDREHGGVRGRKREAGQRVASKEEVKVKEAKLEVERREQAMTRGIAATNVGFKLLAKAGFDGKVGKTNATNVGHEDVGKAPLPIPLAIVVPAKGKGLGAEREELQQAMEALQALNESKARVTAEFEATNRARFDAAKVRGQFKSALKLAHKLDEETHKDPPSAWWSLYEERLAREDLLEKMRKNPLEEIPENVERCVSYLRSTYACCFWCGVKYDSVEDMDANCPGEREEDHQ